VLSPTTIADTLAARVARTVVDRLAKRMVKEGIDIGAYLDEVGRRPLPVKWHMTWFLSHYVKRIREVEPKDQSLIRETLVHSDNKSVSRDLWRALSFVDLDEDIAGGVFDAATRLITESKEPIGLRAHAMYVARNIARPYPELRSELLLVLEGLRKDEGAAIRTRSRSSHKELSTVDH
jgi:hypothetical protein